MFFSVLFVFLCHANTAQDNYSIRRVNFKGNKTFSKSELLEHMAMHETNIYQRLIQKKEPSLYSDEFIEVELERLTRYYQSEGFLFANVTLDSLKVNDKKKKLKVVIRIDEREPITVDSISMVILDHNDEIDTEMVQKKVPKNFSLKKGKRFTDLMLYDDVAAINQSFFNLGYVYAETDYQLKLKPEEKQLCVQYQVEPGNICQFGETTINSNRYVKEKYIRKQLNYKTGDRYDASKLDKTRKQLYNLQLFRVVSVTPQINKSTQENPIPVQIRIEEMQRIMSRFGVGWGTEDKFRAFADVTYRGLFGGTSRINLYAKHSALTPYYFSLTWTEPQFFAKKLSVAVNPYIRRDNEPGYNIQTIGLNFPVGYKFNDYTNASLTYYIEHVTRHSDDVMRNTLDKYRKSGFMGSLVFTNAEPVYSPESGGTITVGGKINGYLFNSNYDYTRWWFDIRKYQKVKEFIFAVRGMIGSIYSSNDDGIVPVEDRFYSGGGNSNRGWDRSMLGPIREDGTPSGGKSILELNVEVRRHLFWRVELAAFMDVSNVWQASYHYSFRDLAYAAGGGIRITTPIGPIRFDVGVPLWNEKRSPQFFLSVGQAF